MTTAAFAYLNARIRGRKAGRLGRDDLVRLAISETPSTLVPLWRDLGPDDDPGPLLSLAYRRLVDEYHVVLRACPQARGLLSALIGLHEIENVKLVWRAIARGRAAEAWESAWRPLGALASIDRDACAPLTTIRSLVDRLQATPYGAGALSAFRAHPDDPAAAELSLERWAAARLQREIAELPERESGARELLTLVIRERDAASSIRAGRTPPLTLAQIGARRRQATERAFQRTPYCLAPLFAYVLMCEDEVRGLLVVAEARARRLDAAGVRRALDAVR